MRSLSYFLLSWFALSLAYARVPFKDVTSTIGITQPNGPEQFGGPTIADLDGDGNYDFIFTYHNLHPLRIFYGSASGRFTRKSFDMRNDVHGVSVAPRTARSREKLLTVSVGGGRGTNLRPPYVFLFKPNRSFTDITHKYGLGSAKSRGRVAVFMDLAKKSVREKRANLGGPDVLFINLLGRNSNLTHSAYENKRGSFVRRRPKNFEKVNEERAIVTDIDNDGVMELVHFSVLRVFKLTGPFQFQDITARVAPMAPRLSRSISAVVELDFDNDGRMDLYLARARSSLVTPRGPATFSENRDVLLRNVGGRYEEVSGRGIPGGSDSMGVSAGDFNNDGWTDLVVTTFSGKDFLLMNDKGKRFRKVELGEVKKERTKGHNVMAVDYDLDGRVDFVVAQGFRKAFKGPYRVMKNQMALGRGKGYLLVRVGNEPSGAVTALNAVVTVTAGGLTMTRRVGGRGAQSGGQSFLDTVHFGLGSSTKVDKVSVRWTTGAAQTKWNVSANQKVQFGAGL